MPISHACAMAKSNHNCRSFSPFHDCTFETIFRINYNNWTLCSSLPLQGYDFLVFLVWLFGYSNGFHFSDIIIKGSCFSFILSFVLRSWWCTKLNWTITINFKNPFAYSKQSLSIYLIFFNWCCILFICMNFFDKGERKDVRKQCCLNSRTWWSCCN